MQPQQIQQHIFHSNCFLPFYQPMRFCHVSTIFIYSFDLRSIIFIHTIRKNPESLNLVLKSFFFSWINLSIIITLGRKCQKFSQAVWSIIAFSLFLPHTSFETRLLIPNRSTFCTSLKILWRDILPGFIETYFFLFVTFPWNFIIFIRYFLTS